MVSGDKASSKLGVSKVAQCSVNPKETITYSKLVQTDQEVPIEAQCRP